MIKSFTFENFKLLRNVTLELGRLNVLVGRNGVGKSTALEGMELLFLHAAGGEARRPSPEWITGDTRLHAVTDGEDGASLRWQGGTPQIAFRAGRNPKAPRRPAPPGTLDLGIAVRLLLLTERIAANHYSDNPRPRIDRSGTGIASVLQYFQGLRDGRLDTIETQLRRVVPGARRLRALPARVARPDGGAVVGSGFQVEFEGQGWIPAHQLSEGTLLTVALLTILHDVVPGLLLIDDVDKGLHPVAQRELIGVLRAVLDTRPDLQVVATSHSPFVLDVLDASEVFVAGAIGPAASRVIRLDRHPAWEKRRDLPPGQFWRQVGEDWVGTVPAS